MVEVQFELDQIKTTINGKLEEPFQNIINRYLNKTLQEPGSLYFISKGKPMNANESIGNQINKVVQGWINYYTHYYKSEFYEVLRYINQCLVKWVRRSFKKRNTRSRAEHWLGEVVRRDRNLFAHWKFGILPSVGEGAV